MHTNGQQHIINLARIFNFESVRSRHVFLCLRMLRVGGSHVIPTAPSSNRKRVACLAG